MQCPSRENCLNYIEGIVFATGKHWLMHTCPVVQLTRTRYPTISEVKSGIFKASAENMSFREIQTSLLRMKSTTTMNFAREILQNFRKREEALKYISQGVSVYDFFKHFKGQLEDSLMTLSYFLRFSLRTIKFALIIKTSHLSLS